MTRLHRIVAIGFLLGLCYAGYAVAAATESTTTTPAQTVAIAGETFVATSPSGLAVQVVVPSRVLTLPGQTVPVPTSTVTETVTVPLTTELGTTSDPGTTADPGTTGGTAPATPDPASGTSITTDAFWGCTKPLSSYGTLPITVHSSVPNSVQYAVGLDAGCRGDGNDSTIDLILDVDGNGADQGPNNDAVKVRGAEDLQVTGDIECGARAPGAHQDGVQAQRGSNVTFDHLTSGNDISGAWTCWGAGGSYFVSATGVLTDVVCDHCSLVSWNQGLGINSGLRSGARDSYFRTHRATACRVVGGSQPVNTGNTCVRRP